MHKFHLAISLTLFLSNMLVSQPNHQAGESLYVWATNGLNVRTLPSTSSKIISKIPFGTKVTIVENTEIAYNITGISNIEPHHIGEKVGPIILNGKWVKVELDNDIIGYVIDQYLLYIEPNNILDKNPSTLNLKLIKIDTVYKSPIVRDGEGLNVVIEKTYEHGIYEIEKQGGVWSSSTFQFENFSFQDIMILFSSSFRDFAGYSVSRNWVNEIHFGNGELCGFTLIQKDGFIEFDIGCSC